MRATFLLLISSSALAGPGPQPGSAFDLTTGFPSPGSRGRLIADGPNLRFEKDPSGTRRVLVGTNLTGMACFPSDDATANRWAADLQRRGYNAVRFHHIDWVIRDNGWGYKQRANRFIAALKSRSIYVTVDLFSQRAKDLAAFKRGVIQGDQSIRNDWASYAKRLLSDRSQVRGCAAWKDEPAIFGICPINEDDPRVIGAAVGKYPQAYQWMTQVVRNTGYKGLIWGINSGLAADSLVSAGKVFDVEDTHIYWDHPHDDTYLDTSGVRQHWQFPGRRLRSKPYFWTEWGSLAYNRLRGETGLFFAGQMAAQDASCVLSYALATNEGMMSSAQAPLDQFAFHSDPVRLATDRAMALLLRRPATDGQASWNKQAGSYAYRSTKYLIDIQGNDGNRRADFLGSLDGTPIASASRLLLIRFGDAQNSGFTSHVVKDRVVFEIDNRGSTPVRELVPRTTYEIRSSKRLQAWALDPYSGARRKSVPCRETSSGVWQIQVQSLNTEIAGR